MAGTLYIESHASLKEHPKLTRLMQELGVSRLTAIGHLHCLWWWAARYADDGQTAQWGPAAIAEGALWTGAPADFTRALQTAGFMDPDGYLHDWPDYFKLTSRREADRKRKSENKKENSIGIPSEFHRNSGPTRPYQTKTLPDRDQTGPDRTGPKEPLSGATPDPVPEIAARIIADLNERSGRAFKSVGDTLSKIRARLAEGFTEAEFIEANKRMVAKWRHDPKMCRYIRPETLYAKSHLDSYRNEPITLADTGRLSPIGAAAVHTIAEWAEERKAKEANHVDD